MLIISSVVGNEAGVGVPGTTCALGSLPSSLVKGANPTTEAAVGPTVRQEGSGVS